ncbi:MAG: SDR family NAD(P)-dependent oxidoreductase [Bacteroidales bacterium]|nr:SDR family NAD(P)-dependent oxidoreductase [Bacteroidales bacterium]
MTKTVFITGATSGIGEACAIKFAQGGYNVIVTGRNANKLAALKSKIEACNVQALTLMFDVRDRDAASEYVKSLKNGWENIDVLINNAGLALGQEKEYEGSLDDYEIMVDTNIKGLLTMTKLIVPGMVARDKGHVINIGSVAGDAAYAGGNVYCATKAAVKALSDGLRIDLVDTSVRVTNLKPGLVETNFSRTRFKGDNDRADRLYKGIVPLTGADIADTAFYCAEAPAHVQIAEVLILATHQASPSIVSRKQV